MTASGRQGGSRGRSVAWLALFGAVLGLWAIMLAMPGSMGGTVPAPSDGAMAGRDGGPGAAPDGAMSGGTGGDIGGSMSGDMDGDMDGVMGGATGGPMGDGGMAMPAPGGGALLSMWLVMMATMMLPVMVPTLAAYETLIRTANGTRAGWLGVLAGYLGTWLGMASLLAAAQMGLARAGLVDAMGAARAAWFAAALLLAAGLWQFTALKETCQGICLAPTAWFLGRWRTGVLGGARMGAGLGAVCVTCCWGYMAVGFVGGTMSMLWMAGATCLMILEKLPQVGRRLRRPVGAAMLAAGAAWPFV